MECLAARTQPTTSAHLLTYAGGLGRWLQKGVDGEGDVL